ncbi:MAG: FtsX-like permease family protein [Paralcaligenes sp.]
MQILPPLLTVLLTAELRAHAGRVLINVIAIAIGVAMGYAVYLTNQAALTEFSQATRSLLGQSDLDIRGPQKGFDEALYARLASLPQVAATSPMVEIDAHLPGRHAALKLLGIDAFRALAVNPGLIGQPAPGQKSQLVYLNPTSVFLSPAALTWLKLKPGDTLTVQVGLDTLTLQIAGTLPVTTEALRVGVMDIGAAQWHFKRLGLLQSINLKLQPGVDVKAFRRTLASILPPGVEAVTTEDSRRVTSNLSRAYRVNLDVLALVALFTGAFLVFSTQALSIIRRRAQLALLRALGMTRGSLLRMVLAEGGIQGLAGALLGLALGLVIATGLLHYAGGDLGGGYFPGIRPTVHFDAGIALAFAMLGVAAALLGSLAPAWEASRAQPAQALKAGDEETLPGRLRSPWPAVGVIVAGVAMSQAGPVAGLPIFGYASIGLLLVGAILCMPRLARWAFSILPPGRGPVPYLALAQLARAPGRAAIGLAGILASFSLMAAMAIMVTSFRVSFEQWLDTVLPAQLYVRASASGDTGYFSSTDQQIIAATPGIARAEFTRTDEILLDPQLPPVAWIARPIDKHHPEARLALVGTPRVPRADEPPPIWVSEAMKDLYGMHSGERVSLPLAGHLVAFTVAGIWRDYARQFGAIAIDLDDYRRLSNDRRITGAALWLAPNVRATQFVQNLRQRLPGASHIEIKDSGEIRSTALHVFDRSFAVTYLLEGIAIVIGLFGVGVSFSMQALARSREFGVLRHLGATRSQIGAMLALEGAGLGLLGMAAGLVLGLGIALILIYVINPQSFHWTMSLHMPWLLLAAVAPALVASASLAALASARRAMSAGAIRAVKEDW